MSRKRLALAVDRSVSEKGVYRGGAKRLLDVLLVLLSGPLAVPLTLFVAALVRVCLGSPVFYLQLRPGLRGRSFTIRKFRTMSEVRQPDGSLLSDSKRLGLFGRLLRSTSLDELPELWNVLRGDMSLVGPRPLLMDYLPLYDERQGRRHEVRPGITGWAQVNGRNALSWEQKFELDVWYVDNVSLALDLKILWRTLASVVRREGISAAGEATMPRFTGSRSAESAAREERWGTSNDS